MNNKNQFLVSLSDTNLSLTHDLEVIPSHMWGLHCVKIKHKHKMKIFFEPIINQINKRFSMFSIRGDSE